ncbi:MAG: HprK-related kinase A [Betaproteobacteria bacterium]
MTAPAARPGRALAEVELPDIAGALESDGLWIDTGAISLRARSDSALLASQLQAVYANFSFVPDGKWADVHVDIMRAPGLRRWIRRQVVLRSDTVQPFEPFPATSPLPLFEWGCNWLIGKRMNDLLLLHAGVVERNGLALLLPAMPGSGKSTLTAALSLRGWRLLSDEFAAFSPEAEVFQPVLKPVALKNESIDVIRRFAPAAVVGPEFPNTRKGTVAHLAPARDAFVRRHEGARPGATVLPRWEAGSPTRWEPVPENVLFPALAFNAFNYSLLGSVGFKAVVKLVRRCPAWQLVYSDLEEALATIEAAWSGMIERQEDPPR